MLFRSFASLIDTAKLADSKHKAIEDINRKPIGYNRLITKSFALGSYIAEYSKTGEYIGILLPNMIVTAITFFACLSHSRVPAMINFSTGSNNIINACKTAKIKQIYTSHKFIEAGSYQDLISRLEEQDIHIIYLEDLKTKLKLKHKLLGLLHSMFPESFYKQINPKLTADEPAVVLFTSGSEGKIGRAHV